MIFTSEHPIPTNDKLEESMGGSFLDVFFKLYGDMDVNQQTYLINIMHRIAYEDNPFPRLYAAINELAECHMIEPWADDNGSLDLHLNDVRKAVRGNRILVAKNKGEPDVVNISSKS